MAKILYLFLYVVALTLGCASAQVHISQFVPFYEPLFRVTSQDPRTWHEMRAQCNEEQPGYFLAMQFENLPPEVVALCPSGTLVPFGVVIADGNLTWDNVMDPLRKVVWQNASEKLHLDAAPKNGPYGALLWPSMQLRMIGNDTKFTCAVCEMAPRLDVVSQAVYPWHDNKDFAYDLELVSYDRVDDIGRVANGSDLVNGLLLDLAKAFNISVHALQWRGAILNEDQKAVAHVHYVPENHVGDWLYYVQWNNEYLDLTAVENFEITTIKLNTQCSAKKKFFANAQRELFSTGTIDVAIVPIPEGKQACHPGEPLQQLVATRECHWDFAEQTAVWSNWISWCPDWSPFANGPGSVLTSIFQLKGDEFRKALKLFDVMVVYQLEAQLAGIIPMFSLRVFVPLASSLVMLHSKETPHATTMDVMSYSIPILMAKTYMQVTLYQNLSTEVCHATWINVLVSNRDSSDPAVGLALTLSDGNENNQVAQLNYKNATLSPNTSHLVVTVSDSIAFSVKRLAIATIGAHLDTPNTTWRSDFSDGYMSAIQVTFMRDDSYGGDLVDDFVDIAFKPVFHRPWLRGKCIERKFTTDEWLTNHCRVLKSLRAGMVVCRCKNLYREAHITTSLYLVYGFDASLSTFLANNRTLVIVMACVSILSALGLLSVVLTAILFPEWRFDQGHKIFLQMILALTVNLVLGFVNNFISIDTKTVACIAIGVVRHYSFLAMFCWMMVLSGLQVKRLTTIAGAKSTTHLILKVSAVAWGLPLIPIAILLGWDTGFYKSEVSNRGYCYPEDVAFQATVQGPAGVILIANLIIFVIILNHIYGWVKCNKDVVVRKHIADSRGAQLRNLGNSIFVFFLFGFTWTFHFLSEEGIINSEFLFEFMFLITASFHLFMLSLFFIVLDKKTRALWGQALGYKKTSKAKM